MDSNNYGLELILDIHNCDPSTFTRKGLKQYFSKLCELLNVEPCALHFWDDVGIHTEDRQTSPHTKGTSAVQFLLTSNITVHTLDLLGSVYLNIFSCKDFDTKVAERFSEKWFRGKIIRSSVLERV